MREPIDTISLPSGATVRLYLDREWLDLDPAEIVLIRTAMRSLRAVDAIGASESPPAAVAPLAPTSGLDSPATAPGPATDVDFLLMHYIRAEGGQLHHQSGRLIQQIEEALVVSRKAAMAGVYSLSREGLVEYQRQGRSFYQVWLTKAGKAWLGDRGQAALPGVESPH